MPDYAVADPVFIAVIACDPTRSLGLSQLRLLLHFKQLTDSLAWSWKQTPDRQIQTFKGLHTLSSA